MSEDFIGKTCPYCQTPLKPGAQVVVCPACKMPHHRDCWLANRGCTTFGCAARVDEAAPPPPTPPSPQRPGPSPWVEPARRRGSPALVVSVILVTTLALLALLAYQRQWFIPQEERILLQVSCNSASLLYSITPDGQDFTRLLSGGADAVVVSADGRLIAFTNGRGVSLVEANHPGERVLTQDRSVYELTFSPDGHYLAYQTWRHDASCLVVVATNGAGRPVEISGYDSLSSPTFSRDGLHLAFSAGPYGDAAIYLANLDGSNRQQIARGDDPVFSPDGRLLAFSRLEDVSSDVGSGRVVYLINTDGTHQRRLLPNQQCSYRPVFSPDSRFVLCAAGPGSGEMELYLTDIANGQSRRLTENADDEEFYAFNHTGTVIAFSTEDGLYTVHTDGSGLKRVTDKGGGKVIWTSLARPTLQHARRPEPAGRLPGYLSEHQVQADFDGDGQQETAFDMAPQDPPSMIGGDPDKPKYVVVMKDGVKQAEYAFDGINRIENLNAHDITGDGQPELLFATGSYGASDGTICCYAYGWSGAKFTNLFGPGDTSLDHMMEGKLIIQPPTRPGPATLILYDFIWGEDESHADAHRYWVEWYAWSGSKFTRASRKETTQRYGATSPLTEFGLTEPTDPALSY